MKLATFSTAKGASYGAVVDKGIVDLGRRLGNRYPDLLSLVAANAFGEAAKLLNEKIDFKTAEVT
jgi:hypothetical protein